MVRRRCELRNSIFILHKDWYCEDLFFIGNVCSVGTLFAFNWPWSEAHLRNTRPLLFFTNKLFIWRVYILVDLTLPADISGSCFLLFMKRSSFDRVYWLLILLVLKRSYIHEFVVSDRYIRSIYFTALNHTFDGNWFNRLLCNLVLKRINHQKYKVHLLVLFARV